jgi:hypothetical protein
MSAYETQIGISPPRLVGWGKAVTGFTHYPSLDFKKRTIHVLQNRTILFVDNSTRVLKLESGNFRAIHRPEAPSFGASRANEGQGGGRLRGMNRTESGVGLGSGHSASTTASLGRGKSCGGCGRAALRRRPVNHHPIAMCILLEDR